MGEICIYDINGLKTVFSQNKNVYAYGNGSFYRKVKDFIVDFGLQFHDVLFTKNNEIVSESRKSSSHLFEDAIIIICSTFQEEIIEILLLNNVKKHQIKRITFHCENQSYAREFKQKIAAEMDKKHTGKLDQLRNKKKIRIVFLVINKGIWKLDLIFKKLENDPRFEPFILVAPYILSSEILMFQEMQELYEFFLQKGYPVLRSYDHEKNQWITLEELQTDMVFFTKPHDSTRKEYYHDAYLNYLGCYAGYGVNVASFRHYSQIDQVFHSAQWKNFANSQFVFDAYKIHSSSLGKNVFLTGDLTCEELLFCRNTKNVWKNQDDRMRIIYAPHHSIEEDKEFGYRLSTFLNFSSNLMHLAIKYKNHVVFAFKPHPVLKRKLYSHPDWGKEKTDTYYDFWKNHEFTQFEDGDYIELFQESDAIIHDSASFLFEYLTQKKPTLYLTSELTSNSLNDLGKEALEACYQASSAEKIEVFIVDVIENKIEIKEEHIAFYNKHFLELYRKKPSDMIYEIIKSELGMEN